jgi:IS30 family transposase
MAGRPRLARELERLFWEQVRLWPSWQAAGSAVGVSSGASLRWARQSGGVKPRLSAPTRRLSYRERCRIEDLLDAQWSPAAIARDLGRARSTVIREIAAHRRARGGRYHAENAQSQADAAARRPKAAKLATNLPLRREVQDRLIKHHSPEQIARRLREEFPNEPEMWVSHETIYLTLFVQARGALKRELATHLRTRRMKRRPRAHTSRGHGRGQIVDAVAISQRPAEVEDRAVPGHWEGDLLIGSGRSQIATLVERSTRFVMLVRLPEGRSTEQVVSALASHVQTLPVQLRRTLTWDRGLELADHKRFTIDTGVQVYFCDPKSPWQRGSNENTNGLLRQYLPRTLDFRTLTQADFDTIADQLNRPPRQTLGFKTPTQALAEVLR